MCLPSMLPYPRRLPDRVSVLVTLLAASKAPLFLPRALRCLQIRPSPPQLHSLTLTHNTTTTSQHHLPTSWHHHNSFIELWLASIPSCTSSRSSAAVFTPSRPLHVASCFTKAQADTQQQHIHHTTHHHCDGYTSCFEACFKNFTTASSITTSAARHPRR